jgi:tRNA (guanine-N7-)-methyltransferase
LHGRRQGRPLSRSRAELVARRLPELLVDIDAPQPEDWRSLFAAPVDALRVEVGCGGGEHLVHEAVASPATGLIGVEPFRQGLAKTVAAIDASGCTNVRLFDHDAALLLDWLPGDTLSRIDVLYPDPWPKRRHWKRRFISNANLDRIARTLRSGGLLRVATDISDYADWTLLLASRHDAVDWTATNADDWRVPWPGWPGTRYEAKALKAGRRPTYLTFRRR